MKEPEELALADPSVARTVRMLARGASLRCPNCAGTGLFRGYTRLLPACPRCGLLLDRGEEDYFLGAYTVNFMAAELGLVFLLFAVVVVTWPAVSWDGILYGGIALMVLLPILFFPFSRTIWLALDLAFRLPGEEDFRRE